MTFEVAKYELEMYSGDLHPFRAKIRLQGTKLEKAELNFSDQRPLPTTAPENVTPIFWFPFDAFAPMMEMLREEKPIWVYDWGGGMLLSTSDQPVGQDQGMSTQVTEVVRIEVTAGLPTKLP